jgi:hypothetical protein
VSTTIFKNIFFRRARIYFLVEESIFRTKKIFLILSRDARKPARKNLDFRARTVFRGPDPGLFSVKGARLRGVSKKSMVFRLPDTG